MFIFSQQIIVLLLAMLLGALIAWLLGLCNCNNAELSAELDAARAERDEMAARLSVGSDNGRDAARAASFAGGSVSQSEHETVKARNSFLEARVKFLEEGTKKPEAKKPAAKKPVAKKPELKVSAAGSMSADELESAVMAAGAGKKPKASKAKKHDDLLLIDGVGPKNNEWLHANGIHTFAQIASMGPAELAWLANNIPNFGSRVYRENWVAQCANLAKGLPAR